MPTPPKARAARARAKAKRPEVSYAEPVKGVNAKLGSPKPPTGKLTPQTTKAFNERVATTAKMAGIKPSAPGLSSTKKAPTKVVHRGKIQNIAPKTWVETTPQKSRIKKDQL